MLTGVLPPTSLPGPDCCEHYHPDGSVANLFICAVCGKTIQGFGNLMQHTARKHNTQSQFPRGQPVSSSDEAHSTTTEQSVPDPRAFDFLSF